MDPHRLAELTSLELHREVARELRRNPQVLERARARVRGWRERHDVATAYADAWAEWLERDPAELCAFLGSDEEEARALRQVSPFAGALDARTRWKIWRAVRAAERSR